MGTSKIGANDPCPCGSGTKYKKCCRDVIDWPSLIIRPLSEQVKYLSLRGKNMLFMSLLADALQLNKIDNRPAFKKAFTPPAVKKIYEAVRFVWPNGEDLARVLRNEKEHRSGIYIGPYEPEGILKGITRHSLYADTILLVDPLIYPDRIKDEYNPLLHPEQYRSTALRWVTLWFELV